MHTFLSKIARIFQRKMFKIKDDFYFVGRLLLFRALPIVVDAHLCFDRGQQLFLLFFLVVAVLDSHVLIGAVLSFSKK